MLRNAPTFFIFLLQHNIPKCTTNILNACRLKSNSLQEMHRSEKKNYEPRQSDSSALWCSTRKFRNFADAVVLCVHTQAQTAQLTFFPRPGKLRLHTGFSGSGRSPDPPTAFPLPGAEKSLLLHSREALPLPERKALPI
mmetsp:Transcript_11297/g.30404  ORF Transcript_11297/g.30404 Transcript_11297/m.30404 type:complete len:139 (-) Transcript_11297:153-569(-)